MVFHLLHGHTHAHANFLHAHLHAHANLYMHMQFLHAHAVNIFGLTQRGSELYKVGKICLAFPLKSDEIRARLI